MDDTVLAGMVGLSDEKNNLAVLFRDRVQRTSANPFEVASERERPAGGTEDEQTATVRNNTRVR